MADAALLEQALVNIVKNGAESVAASGRADGYVEVEAGRDDSGCVAIVVTDNGPGLSDACRARLFTPFFTDKPGGQGIGLMAVREILRSQGCAFTLVTSAADRLTRFTINFA